MTLKKKEKKNKCHNVKTAQTVLHISKELPAVTAPKNSCITSDAIRITSDLAAQVLPVGFLNLPLQLHVLGAGNIFSARGTGTCLMGVAHSLTHSEPCLCCWLLPATTSNTPEVQSLEIESSFHFESTAARRSQKGFTLELKINLPFNVHLFSLYATRAQQQTHKGRETEMNLLGSPSSSSVRSLGGTSNTLHFFLHGSA